MCRVGVGVGVTSRVDLFNAYFHFLKVFSKIFFNNISGTYVWEGRGGGSIFSPFPLRETFGCSCIKSDE